MSRADLGVIVLAAGQGTRMKSALPKILHPVCGMPMVRHVINAARSLSPGRVVVVVGHGSAQVREALAADDVMFVEQTQMLGTGDAVRRSEQALAGMSEVMVLNGDCPLVGDDLVATLARARANGPLAFVTATVDDPGRLGRLLRDANGAPERIVEAADWQGEGGPAEINAGQYVFHADWLWRHVAEIPPSAKGEHYLTDLVWAASREGAPGIAIPWKAEEVLGVDDRVKLAEAERVMRTRIIERNQRGGVTIVDPATTYIDAGVIIAADVTIQPGCFLTGATDVATNATIGPGTTLRDSRVGERSTVRHSVIEDSEIGARCNVGPFAHVRGGAVIGDDCELGNYSEVKNSRIGNGVKMHHFSYMGDADIGEGTNIAAGAITCNWDGVNKHRTTIGAHVFIGCDTMLVAPISIGDGALTGAGSVVTKDVAPGVRVAGVPARPIPGQQD